MALKLKPYTNPPTSFSWRALSPASAVDNAPLPSPPTAWLPAQDMKLYGSQPLTSVFDIGLVKCKECEKTILRTCMVDHIDKCATIRAGSKKGSKSRFDTEDAKTGLKKRRASPSPDDPPKKKAKPTKVTKGRMRGPVDLDKQCGVINDKNLPCSRSLTCKSHSMGAKRAVQGRSKPYDELLLEWQRANNPNFVEPVKRETKAEKKEKREREKLEKKKLADEAASALGHDSNASIKKVSLSSKKTGKKAAAAAVRPEDIGEDVPENLDELDTEAELDELVLAVKTAKDKGTICTPLALPGDASTWFVHRRERARCCRDLLVNALGGGTGMMSRSGSIGVLSRNS